MAQEEARQAPGQRFLKRLAALALCASVAACYQITGAAPQPPMSRAPTVTHTYIAVNWVEDVDAIAKACNGEMGAIIVGCAHVEFIEADTSVCTIWAPQPHDFNDLVRLVILGHEVFHCFGARHDVAGPPH